MLTKKQYKAAIIGGLIVFLWGIFSWMVFPWHQKCMKKFKDESAVAHVIKKNAPESGVYVLPNTFDYSKDTSKDEMKRGVRMMEKGPFMFANVKVHGIGGMSVKPFIISFIIHVIGACIVTWMLVQAKGLDFRTQVGFVTLFGLAMGILTQLSDWNWWGFPFAFAFTNIVDMTIGWFLAGLGIAKLLKAK